MFMITVKARSACRTELKFPSFNIIFSFPSDLGKNLSPYYIKIFWTFSAVKKEMFLKF
jgi:hypothetical protein